MMKETSLTNPSGILPSTAKWQSEYGPAAEPQSLQKIIRKTRSASKNIPYSHLSTAHNAKSGGTIKLLKLDYQDVLPQGPALIVNKEPVVPYTNNMKQNANTKKQVSPVSYAKRKVGPTNMPHPILLTALFPENYSMVQYGQEKMYRKYIT